MTRLKDVWGSLAIGRSSFLLPILRCRVWQLSLGVLSRVKMSENNPEFNARQPELQKK